MPKQESFRIWNVFQLHFPRLSASNYVKDKPMFRIVVVGAVFYWLSVTAANAKEYFVENPYEYSRASASLKAGDTIILANGEWKDFDLVVTGEGRKEAPITILAQSKGKVLLTGRSSLRIGGRYVLVTGLVFRNGYSPRSEVISFRRNKRDLAAYSRVTEVVIDGFSKPDKQDADYWVGLYGKNNRFDHNHLVGKTNKGVTLAVRLDSAESRHNNHRIDHNYFGPRPALSTNGGETIRIGTSTYSEHVSNTLVEKNVFDRTDGEIEIISSKSGGNIYRENLFLRAQGALTLRHGDGNLVERNVFLGHGKAKSGGIRVINRNQIVRENYMEGLRGTGFWGALTIMNGVPDSPKNRYVRVENAQIERNTIVDSTRITFGAGADSERLAAPINSCIAKNLLSGTGEGTFIEADADVSGIRFVENRLLKGSVHSAIVGLHPEPAKLERKANGLLYPVDERLIQHGAPLNLVPTSLESVGVAWYPKPSP